MGVMRDLNQHLKRRGSPWHYVRRVPSKYREFDKRTFIRKGLDAKLADVARAWRDLFEEADDLYWASLSSAADGAGQKVKRATNVSSLLTR